MKRVPETYGMACPNMACHSLDTKVTKTRDNKLHNLRTRKRKCNVCGCEFSSEEHIVRMFPGDNKWTVWGDHPV